METLIICLKRKGKTSSYLVDSNLNVIREFKSTYSNHEYIPSIQKIIDKGTKSIVVDTLANGIKNLQSEQQLKKQKMDGKTFISDKEIDDIVNKIINE